MLTGKIVSVTGLTQRLLVHRANNKSSSYMEEIRYLEQKCAILSLPDQLLDNSVLAREQMCNLCFTTSSHMEVQ